MNYFRTAGLMAVLIVLFALVGSFLGGTNGMLIAFGVAVVMNAGSYWFSDKVVLKMYGAEIVERADAPDLYDAVDRLRQRADLPMPRVAVIPSDQPNAFATGRNPQHAVVAVTSGIQRMLSQDELEGVIAHELAHVKNRDILTSSIAATMAAAITLLARFGLFFGGGRDRRLFATLAMLIVAPLAAFLIQAAISRSREYAADRGGAEICGRPRALAGALEKLEAGAQQVRMNRSDQTSDATAHLFIVNPFSGGMSGLRSLFSTHPATEERVRLLEEMDG
ncbi:MAG: zinc metalloprotease HtpX [Bacteroidetes bacterium QH_8_67_23]|nr:MAG: zinc metalloprotease HtpX [Bacteroidetes bacterium QH_8_67_23]